MPIPDVAVQPGAKPRCRAAASHSAYPVGGEWSIKTEMSDIDRSAGSGGKIAQCYFVFGCWRTFRGTRVQMTGETSGPYAARGTRAAPYGDSDPSR